MQNQYHKTHHSVQGGGSLVDLERFRQKQSLAAQRDSLARALKTNRWLPEDGKGEQPAPRLRVLTTTPAQRRHARRNRQAWRLDICASLSIIFMTVIFALRVIL